MAKRLFPWLAAFLSVVGLGCAADVDSDPEARDAPPGGKADGFGEGSPKALAVLAVVNEASLELLSAPALEGGVGLDHSAAENIVGYRDGADGEAGTSDDESYDSLGELDAVPDVGPVALEALTFYVVENRLCERSQGFELLLSNYKVRLTFGLGQHQGMAVLEERVHADCSAESSTVHIFNHGRTVNTRPGNFRVIGREKKVFAATGRRPPTPVRSMS